MLEFYKGKTVLITGHSGFKGSWLSEILILAGAKVIGYSLEPPTKPNLFGLLHLDKRMVSITGDVRDYQHILEVLKTYKPEIVFHLAAQPIVLTGYDQPRYTYEVNVMGTVNILEAIRNTDCVRSFVNVTTDKVYENKDESEHPFKEEENLDGFDPYSNSKSCSELVTRCYKRSFFQNSKVCISTARAGNVIGGGDFSPNRIIPDCVRAIESKKPIEIRNPYSTRPYQFVLEPLFAYLLIAEKQLSGKSGSFNIGPDSADFVSTGSLVSLFCKKWGPSANYVDKSVIGAPHEASFLSLDNSLFKQTFSWSPVYHIDKAIDEIVEWTKTYFAGGDIAAVVDKQIFEFSKRFLQ